MNLNFDKDAKNWDEERRIKRAKMISGKILDCCDLTDISTAMEFGCATGLISFNLKDRFDSITLVDNSKGMIDVLNKKIKENNMDKMNAKCINLLEEDLEQKFDFIYTSMALHHIKNLNLIIDKFYNLLNENGHLCIVDLNEEDGTFHSKFKNFDGHNGFNQEELKKILKEKGFKKIDSKTIFEDTKIINDKEFDYSLFLMNAKK